MSSTGEKLYSGYLRQKMPTIASKVKVREILIHLPCLTARDRESVEAKRENNGNYDSMVLLLDRLKRRENWPEQFIEGLEACGHRQLAAEIRAEYEKLNASEDSSSASSPSTVTKVHVHPAPAASPLVVPESSEAPNQADVDLPGEAPAEAPSSPEIPLSLTDQVSEAVCAPEPLLEPPPFPSTPPPSPETPRAQQTDAPLQEEEFISNQESGINVPEVSGDAAPIPDESNSVDEQAASFQQQPLTPSPAVPLQPAGGDDAQSPTQKNAEADDGTFFSSKTTDKVPVQDSSPIIVNTVLQPEETSAAAEVSESISEVEPAPPVISEPPAGEISTSLDDVGLSEIDQTISIPPQSPTETPAPTSSQTPEPNISEPPAGEISTSLDDVGLSEIDQTVSIPPQSPTETPAPKSSQTSEPYIGNCLETSEAATESDISSDAPIFSHQETDLNPNHNEPEKNHDKSPNESLVQEVAVQDLEDSTILNQEIQITAPHQLLNGEAAKEVLSALSPSNNHPAVCLTDLNPAEPAPVHVSPDPEPLQSSEGKMSPDSRPSNTKYILTAAAVCAGALLMAWRFRK